MEYKTAYALLKNYPALYNRYEHRRESILESCYSCPLGDIGRRVGGGSHAAPTEALALNLFTLSEAIGKLNVVIDFMGTLNPQNRQLIISVWRYGEWGNWRHIASRMKLTTTDCRRKWNQLIINFQAFAGAANDQPGTAFAGGPSKEYLA